MIISSLSGSYILGSGYVSTSVGGFRAIQVTAAARLVPRRLPKFVPLPRGYSYEGAGQAILRGSAEVQFSSIPMRYVHLSVRHLGLSGRGQIKHSDEGYRRVLMDDEEIAVLVSSEH